ncbi:Ankyrin-2 [Phytophthora citrophthora]|uniref:Ankyrin-2 n=1 Tax=Phytophthora citrophthora TaxID=4793 RepID=A0AAD9LNF3_9STRA|nr:Ankyrin-2 [Phytophthora citrophthora]
MVLAGTGHYRYIALPTTWGTSQPRSRCLMLPDGNIYTVRNLVEQGADKEEQNKYGNTPLALAALNGYLEVVQYLVVQGANKENQNNDGESPLVLSAWKGHSDVVQYLTQNNDGNTPLALAARDGHLAVAQSGQREAEQIWQECIVTGRYQDVVQHLNKNNDTVSTFTALFGRNNAAWNLISIVVRYFFGKGKYKGGQAAMIRNDLLDGTTRNLIRNKAELIDKDDNTKQQVPVRGEPESEDPTWFVSPETIVKVDGTVLAKGRFGEVYRANWANSNVVVKKVTVVEFRSTVQTIAKNHFSSFPNMLRMENWWNI